MNKLMPLISDFLQTKDYRGITLYQHSRLVDDLDLISDLFKRINSSNNKFQCKETDESYKKFCLDYGWKTTVPRKTLFPDLEAMNLITRTSFRKNGWDEISLTDEGKNFLMCHDKRICIESAHRSRIEKDPKFREFISRMEILVSEVGVLFWWDVWMCSRLDISFQVVKNTIKEIRTVFGYNGNKNHFIFVNKITPLFFELNQKGKKQNGSIDFNNILNKITSFGVKAIFFFFKVDGEGRYIKFRNSFTTSENKVTRKNKRTLFYLLEDKCPSNFDYHHICPFVNTHNNQHFQGLIDGDENLIPLTKNDHLKFPKRNNTFVNISLQKGKIRFYCLENTENYIEIENTNHLNLKKIEQLGIPYNRELVKKIFE